MFSANVRNRTTIVTREFTSRMYLLAMLGLATSSVISDPAIGNPTGNDPSKPLKTHATVDGATALANALYEIYNEELIHVTKMYENRNNPASFSDRQISKSAARLWKARRDAKHLELMSEPAGADLSRKLFLLAHQIDQFGLAYARTPRGSQMMTKLTTKLQREQPRFQKFLQQAATSLQNGGAQNVFTTQMETKGEEKREALVFFRPLEHKKYLLNFEVLLSEGDQQQRKQRRTEYLAKATEKVNTELASAAASAAEMKRISRELVDTGSAALSEGVKGSGVQAFSHVAELWGQASANLTRANAIGWIMTNRNTEQISSKVSKLRTEALATLTAIINSVATHTPPDQIPAAYTSLLRQISVLDRRTSGRYQVSESCKPALDLLAKRNSTFPARIESYKRATSEPLRWRSSFASQQAKYLSTQYADAGALLMSKEKFEKSIRPNFNRTLGGETVLAAKNFNEPADWMVYEAANRLVGKTVREGKLIRLSPTSRTAAVPFLDGHYANIPVTLPVENALADLRTALLIDDKHQALSSDATEAISSGEMQDYLAVGGTIQQVQLESLVTRFIAFPDLAIALTPLGGLPQPTAGNSPLEQTCWRLDISPNWGHSRYFTVRSQQTPTTGNQTAQTAN